MIDIHNHLLYGIDDGARTQDETIQMLKVAAEDGTQTIVATPHFIYGANLYDKEQLINRYEEVLEIIEENNIPIQLLLGNEIYLDEHIVDEVVKGNCLTLGDSSYVLVECYKNASVESIQPIIYQLKLHHYQPIIAHIERLIHHKDDLGKVLELKECGCLFQVNARSITNPRTRKDKKLVLHMLKKKWIHFIASDAHNIKVRKPILNKAYRMIKRKFGQDYADQLFIHNAESFLTKGGTPSGRTI